MFGHTYPILGNGKNVNDTYFDITISNSSETAGPSFSLSQPQVLLERPAISESRPLLPGNHGNTSDLIIIKSRF